MSVGGSGGGSNTVTQVQQIPDYEQAFSGENQDLSRSLASQPYPQYQGQLIAGFTPQQQAGMSMAGQASTAYQPDLGAAEGLAGRAMSIDPSNSAQVGQYMSPYVMQALAPQITALQTQLGQQHNQIGAQATQAGAFGDARQGTQDALADFYGNQTMTGLVGQGFNTAFGNAQQTMLGQQQANLAGANAFAGLGGQQQQLGISGSNALFTAGQQQQQQQQQGLNTAYQQFQNQSNWPFQMLNVRESALSNSPYNISNSTTLPNANTAATNLGSSLNIAGLLGGLGSGSSNNSPFGGASLK